MSKPSKKQLKKFTETYIPNRKERRKLEALYRKRLKLIEQGKIKIKVKWYKKLLNFLLRRK